MVFRNSLNSFTHKGHSITLIYQFWIFLFRYFEVIFDGDNGVTCTFKNMSDTEEINCCKGRIKANLETTQIIV